MCTQAICYYRVSTDKPGKSGLGLEAHQNVARQYCASQGLDIIDEHIAVVSGNISDRALRGMQSIRSTAYVNGKTRFIKSMCRQ